MNSRSVRLFGIGARLIVTLGAVWLISYHIDWSVLLGLLMRADPRGLILASIVMIVQFAIMVWRWQLVIRLLDCGSVAAGRLAVVLGHSMLVGQPLPSTVGGDVVRVVSLAPQMGMDCAVRSVVCDRIIALLALLVLVALTLPLFFVRVGLGPTLAAVVVVSIAVVAGLVGFVIFARAASLAPWLAGHASTLVTDLRRVIQGGEKRDLVLLLSLATHIFSVLLIYTFAFALAEAVSLVDCLIILPPALLISAFPLSLGGWGLREGAIAAGFVMVGASSEAGVATSILFGLTGPLIGLASGLAMPFMRAYKVTSEDQR